MIFDDIETYRVGPAPAPKKRARCPNWLRWFVRPVLFVLDSLIAWTGCRQWDELRSESKRRTHGLHEGLVNLQGRNPNPPGQKPPANPIGQRPRNSTNSD